MLLQILRGKTNDLNNPATIVSIARDFVDLELFGNHSNARVLFKQFAELGLCLDFVNFQMNN